MARRVLRRLAVGSAAAALCAFAACGGDDVAAACEAQAVRDGGATALPDDVDDILERRCRPCHSDPPQMFAPMPLVTFEHVHAPRSPARGAEPVFETIARRIHDERYPMPPVTFPPLSRDELERLDAWLADCAPAAADP